jgi:DNA polymerase III delta' subunit
VKAFSRIRGQEQAVSILSAALESGRLAHAYLLTGPQGTGRLSIALDLAASWLCSSEENGYCGECVHCRRIFDFTHPDVRLTLPVTSSISPEQIMELLLARRDDGMTPLRFEGNTSIKISQVRELVRRMAMKSFEGRGRVELILDADRITVQAANALLKTLEEPTDGTLIVLSTSFYTRILPTIRSRAHLIRLSRIPVELIIRELVDRMGIDEQEASGIASASDGSIGNALLLTSQDRSECRISVNILSELADCDSSSDVSGLASRLVKEFGRDGLLVLCRDARSVVHDIRRRKADRLPLRMEPEPIPGEGIDDYLESVMYAFTECESMLSRNVMPAMALNAALIGCWELLREGGSQV